MSSFVLIQPTKFVDLDLDGNETGVKFGMRVSDDEESTYQNWDESFDSIRGKTPREIFEMARAIDEVSARILDAAVENGSSVWIGDASHDAEELASPAPAP